MLPMEICRLRVPNKIFEKARTSIPTAITHLWSTLFARKAQITSPAKDPNPLGLIARPLRVAVYPISCCKNKGRMARVEYKTAPITKCKTVPMAKFLSLNTLKSTIGSFTTSSLIINAMKVIPTTVADHLTQLAPNQSDFCPLSRIICNTKSQIISKINPQ